MQNVASCWTGGRAAPLRWAVLLLGCAVLCGCPASAPPNPAGNTTPTTSDSASTPTEPATPSSGTTAAGAPPAPKPIENVGVEIMTEIDGIPIPRIEGDSESLNLNAKIPVDVGNPDAQGKPIQPVTGDWIVVRFNSEPKVMNPLTETSAVQTYMGQYVQEALARQDPETFEYHPHIAKQWIVEDSVKLSADFPGQERGLVQGDGKPATELPLTFKNPPADDEDAAPTEVALKTVDGQGAPSANTWVGVFPKGKILGAPTNGYHFWSNDKGEARIRGIVDGDYVVRVGAELYGKATEQEDGSLVVKAATAENPLTGQLKEKSQEALTLKKGEWQDLQRETYFTYYLRDDVKWSDGAPFTTKDLEFAYALMNNPSVDGDAIRTYYADLIECKGLSPHVIRMRYRQQYFKAFEFTAGLGAYTPPFHFFENILKKEGKTLTFDRLTEEAEASSTWSIHGQPFAKFFNTDSRYNRAPLGTGPYVVSEWKKGETLTLKRNPDYWLPERGGHLDRLIFKFIPDNASALKELQAGTIDFFYQMSPDEYFLELEGPPAWFKDKYVKAEWYSPLFSYIGWNLRRPWFEDRRVRVALAMLLDKEQFLKTKMFNAGKIVSGSQYMFGEFYDHSVKPIAYDPETARELLNEAGWVDSDNDGVLDKDGRKFELLIEMPAGNPVVIERIQLLQKSLKSVGITLEVRYLEWAAFIDKVRAKDFDIITLSWASSPESDPYQIWHSSGAALTSRGSNAISFDNPEADELIEKIRVTVDKEERRRLHYALHRVIDREQPYMFLYVSKDLGAYHKRFRNVKWYRLRPGYDLSEWYVPKELQQH